MILNNCPFLVDYFPHQNVGEGVQFGREKTDEEDELVGLVLTQHFSEGVATQPHTHVLAQQGVPLWGVRGWGVRF